MEKTTGSNLNKYFEIIGLLYGCSHTNFIEKELWENAAAEYGIDGTQLFNKFGAIHKKYFTIFRQNMTFQKCEDFDFFFADDDFLILLQTICADNSEWFDNDFSGVTDDTIILAIINELLEGKEFVVVPPLNEIITLLQSTKYSTNICWKLMVLIQSPKKKMESLLNFIKQNIVAYQKAIDAIKKPLDKLLTDFPNGNYMSKNILKDVNPTPILIYPAIEIVNSRTAYVGLFAKDVYKHIEKVRSSQKKLLPALKALGDSSKFDILLTLLTAPKYNLELAEKLNLSAATVSHHMNVLLSNQLVNVEKKDGRVYYTISKETLRDLTNQISSIFSL